MVEAIYRRYHSRDLLMLGALATQVPHLHAVVFLNVLTTIGFPGSSLFAAKLLFLTHLSQYSWLLLALFAASLVLWLPLAFMRIWVPV
jgi:NADH:ubiquinone oxidoreductase subunit 4 (subunit M)